jgi:predicted RNA-binding Zn-ribbon protein involved in translation (DUF1610 family)
MQPGKSKKICNHCRTKTMRTWSGYLCPKCGTVFNTEDTIRDYNNKVYQKR